MDTLKKKRLIIYTISFLFWFSSYVYNPYMTPYLLSLGIGASLAGTIVGAYGISQFFCRLPLGVFAGKFPKHRLFITAGMVLCTVASVMRYYFPNAVVFFLANVITGFAASTWISYTILNSMYYEKAQLHKAIGLLTASNNLGILVAYVVGGLLYNSYGMPAMFVLSIVSGLMGIAVCLMLKDEQIDSNDMSVLNLLSVIKQKRLIIFSVLAFLLQFIVFATANSFSNSVIQDAGISSFQLSMCAAMFTFAGVLSCYFVGTKLGQKIGSKKLLAIGFLLLMIYCFTLPHMTSFVGFAVMQFVGGLGGVAIFSLCTSNCIADVAPEQRSTAMGFFQSIYSLGIMAGPMVMGSLVDWFKIVPSFAIIGVCCILSTVFVLLSNKSKKYE